MLEVDRTMLAVVRVRVRVQQCSQYPVLQCSVPPVSRCCPSRQTTSCQTCRPEPQLGCSWVLKLFLPGLALLWWLARPMESFFWRFLLREDLLVGACLPPWPSRVASHRQYLAPWPCNDSDSYNDSGKIWGSDSVWTVTVQGV